MKKTLARIGGFVCGLLLSPAALLVGLYDACKNTIKSPFVLAEEAAKDYDKESAEKTDSDSTEPETPEETA